MFTVKIADNYGKDGVPIPVDYMTCSILISVATAKKHTAGAGTEEVVEF